MRATRQAWAGDLPARYGLDWVQPFETQLGSALKPGAAVLDVGAGRRPALAPGDRPRGCRYVGLDVSALELAQAPPGSYDEALVADATVYRSQLEGKFDLIISWQALEHFKSLTAALVNLNAYLRPGGRLVAMLSGSASAFAVLNRLVPSRLATPLLAQVMRRPPETVHRAFYHRCRYRALSRLLASWSDWEITPEYRGASYFDFAPMVRALYIAYEEWAYRRRHFDLATHYRINATK